jgi:hypothetical protein
MILPPPFFPNFRFLPNTTPAATPDATDVDAAAAETGELSSESESDSESESEMCHTMGVSSTTGGSSGFFLLLLVVLSPDIEKCTYTDEYHTYKKD